MEPILVKTSIINYLEPLHGGIPIHIAITMNDDVSYEAIYWLHPEGIRYLEVYEDFLELFDIESIEELPFLKELMDDIDLILPPHDEIFDELLPYLNVSTSGQATLPEKSDIN
jgi:hypothetical protein